MTACHKIGLQFAFPVYLLSIVVVIIVVCNLGQCRGFSSFRFVRLLSGKTSSLIGSKAVTVLATLFLLSYTKILRTTILILHSATVIATDCDENQSSSDCENLTVWYVNGSMAYKTHCHGILFWVAVGIFSPFLVLFTSFLLFFPLMEKHLSRFRCWDFLAHATEAVVRCLRRSVQGWVPFVDWSFADSSMLASTFYGIRKQYNRKHQRARMGVSFPHFPGFCHNGLSKLPPQRIGTNLLGLPSDNYVVHETSWWRKWRSQRCVMDRLIFSVVHRVLSHLQRFLKERPLFQRLSTKG